MDWLTATRSFIALAEHESFTLAAEHEGVSASAMSKRIDWIEKQLGISLFTRTTRLVKLTTAGHSFLPKANAVLIQFDAMINHSDEATKVPSGTLKIAATLAVGSHILLPHIQTFLAKYSQVTIQLNVLNPGALPDLRNDLVITRQFEQFDSAAHKGTRLLDYQMHLFASPDYIEHHADVQSIDDLAHHKMLLSNYYQKKGHIELSCGSRFLFNNYNFVSDNLDSILEAAIQGMGLIFISPSYIQKQLHEGTLVPLLPKLRSATKQLWAYYPKSTFVPLNTRLFIDHLKQQLTHSVSF
ncbi:LysR family transcriptional regulator [Pseudoalteromonas sp. MMG013]|uniref:LysR family transcriptional regulator n=1 Tax=Pseudoalteromonas sp. MMG013 TaxID=2822687 RepID=UPI001B384E49|nr:LysR family transcriptional regulator [Pseudoalteromonas sp. MMG013]MBQ4863925.1 LysR family transcriptional regulator [Pseudoalteromonas sp. MMG013]